ncbi:MAG: pyruvate formate-lyase [Bacteroidetes bacterium]|nr:pyruvate formate-lyase [Bacteroidota bacterium]
MKKRIRILLDNVIQKKHHQFRQNIEKEALEDFTRSLKEQDLPDVQRAKLRLSWVMAHEIPVILTDERIVFTKTVTKIPEIFTSKEWDRIKSNHYIHEMGRVCNISSNFSYTIEVGLEKRRLEVIKAIETQTARGNRKGIEFLEAVLQSIEDVLRLSERYALKARDNGREDLYLLLQNIPKKGAKTFHEALQFFRILHFTLWASGNYHNTVGRFDQYMYEYLKNDLDNGTLDYEDALELLEEFFISFNKDSDLYPGMQQGDNGQSMVLGGIDRKGDDSFNILSEMCLKASLELKIIDPKINLRVNKNTPVEQYDLGTELTKEGLGFPQYSNDDIVIPGLLSKGYNIEDARDYVVAACWEFIIPGYGMDIPNITALSFVKVINRAVNNHLIRSKDFDTFMENVRKEISVELTHLTILLYNIYFEPAPFQSLLMNDCIDNAQDISQGNRYNNYGIHGTGISTAVDSLAAIKKFVFDERSVSAKDLIQAVSDNFEGHYDLWVKLKYHTPRMGNDDDAADNIAIRLLDFFSELSSRLVNERGGCYRPGTGSAMYYLWHVKDIGASADGRKQGEPLSANFSPGLNIKLNGPVSIIRSFSKPDMKKIMNGGPLTLELHNTVFNNPGSIRKVSSLVKAYMDLGGQQLQINAVNREKLIQAKKHPEQYKNLIVRVWGWSGYFVELDELYQDHIIQRTELEL